MTVNEKTDLLHRRSIDKSTIHRSFARYGTFDGRPYFNWFNKLVEIVFISQWNMVQHNFEKMNVHYKTIID